MNNSLKSLLYFILNIAVWIVASFFALFFRYDFSIPFSLVIRVIPAILSLIMMFYIISYLDSKLFGRSRRNSIEDFFSIVRRYLTTGILYFVFLLIYPNFFLPRSFPILASVLALSLFAFTTKTLKYIYQLISIRNRKILVGIYGAGQQGQLLTRKILSDNTLDWKPIVIFDDDIDIELSKVNGIKVVTGISLERFLKKYDLQILIISFSKISNERLQIIQETCNNFGVQLQIIPPIKALSGTDFSVSDVRRPTQEELIGKTSLKINFSSVANYFQGKSILITGAGGSIGSEIARQISNCNPKDLFLLDRDESGLLDVDISIDNQKLLTRKHIILADIRDQDRMLKVFSQIKPEIVFHAAALKHLNILEVHPDEGYKTNVEGTNNLLASTIGNNVKTFVNISTDKAADPISILGKTKLISEQLTAGYADIEKNCKFVSVRFGNVFGSRGSVLQTFSKQIELGAPITITDPKVERYFMTLEESVHLVLQAATQGESGDTLILKMGEPILIRKIADKLIKASGKNIEIKFSSLRPGEKLSELLVGKNEKKLTSQGEETIRIKVNPITWLDVPRIWSRLLQPSITDQN
jgi:FlaA1/EpsC-like NDP-sugar epimerase